MKYIDRNIPHHAVSNPINTDEFHPTLDSGGRGKRPFTILYAGRIAEEKKIDIVIRAAAAARKAIPDIRVIVVGRGAYEAQLRTLAKSLDMESSVEFTGFVPNADLASYYAKSDVFAIMSTAETQSIVAMQALACKIPVIAADAWGFKEYITPEVGFLIKPDDVAAVTGKIVYLYEHPDVRARMGEKGREQVAHYSIANIATIWEGIYRNVIAEYNKKI
jgi:glycosyltransferase involved in cell wall biosynthesis